MTISDTLRELATAVEENEALKQRISILESEVITLRSKVGNSGEKEWFSPAEAAEYIGRSVDFLATDRLKRDSQGRPKKPKIPFVKHGHSTVRYHRDELNSYLERLRAGTHLKAA